METDPSAGTEPALSAVTGGDESIDAIVAAELEAAAAEGVETVAPEGTDTKEPKPAEAAAKPTEPAAKAPEKDPEPSASEARRILAQAERVKSEATQRENTFKADFLKRLREAPKATLAEHGLGATAIDDLIDASIREGEVKVPSEAESRLSSIDKRLADIETREKQLKIDQRRGEIHAELTAEKFPTIVAKKSQGLVTDFMFEYFQKHGKPIAWEKAAKLVESDLREFAGAPAPKPTPAGGAKPAAAGRTPHDTLANSDQRTTVPTDDDKTANMSPDQLIKYLVEQAENA
jgi:hypothetical protein